MIVFTRHLCDGCGLEFDVSEGESAYVVNPNVPVGALGWAMRLAFGDSLATFCDRACFERLSEAVACTDLLDQVRDAIGELMRSVGMRARQAEERAETFGREQPCERIQRPELHEPEVAHRCGTFSAQAILSQQETVGNMLRRVREDAGLTLRDMAERMGFQVSSVSGAERDTRRLTDAELERWADSVGTHPDALVPLTLGERMKSDTDVIAAYASLAQEPPGGTPCGFAEANDPPPRPLGDDEPQRPNQPAPADL